jgi:hypothetical protein
MVTSAIGQNVKPPPFPPPELLMGERTAAQIGAHYASKREPRIERFEFQ